jgi:glutamate dehydrogenase (NAD(P)+)
MIKLLSEITEKTISPKVIERMMNKGDERSLVFSGLEETMITSFIDIRNICKTHDYRIDLRTAAYIVAIDKIANCYKDNGIFP